MNFLPLSRRIAYLAALAMLTLALPAQALRIKEVAAVQGVRNNQLSGYGLVVGLDGTGDKSGMPITGQAMQNYLQQMGISLPPGSAALKLDNVAPWWLRPSCPRSRSPAR